MAEAVAMPIQFRRLRLRSALDATRNPPTIVTPTPYFAGTAAVGMAPPIAIGDDVLVFPSQEAALNEDLNGDGDMADTVLCCTRILPQ